jgi:hypothetical protein
LADAAVATGAVAIPLKLPAPEEGTDAHPDPKSVMDALACCPEAADDDIIDFGDDEDDAAGEPPELHAAVPTARPEASTAIVRTRLFIAMLLSCCF